MQRASRFLVGISLLITGLLGLPLGSALAINSNSSTSSLCKNNSGFPAPYTGGADMARFFHLSDGSTVTVTTTGAVIKQSPCHTAYREGWIKVSDICNIQSAQDLNGRLAPGNTNPYGKGNFTSCSSNTQSSSTTQRPTQTTSPPQTQSQSVTVNVPQVQAASTAKPAAQSTSATKTLPNTGAGSVAAIFGGATILGTLGHLLYVRRVRQ